MVKAKTTFYCRNCGAQSSKWLGRCPSCSEWNTFVEEVIQREKKSSSISSLQETKSIPVRISEVTPHVENRIDLHDAELNRVLGGGLVPGSTVLIGGEPGIGKSTLMLQIALRCKEMKVLYISGEESEEQIRMRAGRTGIFNQECYILTETSLEAVFQHLQSLKPAMVVIDSIQTLQTEIIDSSAGSIFTDQGMCRGNAEVFKDYRRTGIPHRPHHERWHDCRPEDPGTHG